MISILIFYTFCYNMLSILYNLLSHIYHSFWLLITSEYLLYFNILVFLFQIYDSISSIHSQLKIILRKIIPCELNLSCFGNVLAFLLPSPWRSTHHKPLYLLLSVVCFFIHPLWWIRQWNNHLFTYGFQHIVQEHM